MSLCRKLRGGTRNAADEHGGPEGRMECGNTFLDLKRAGELCVLETCTQGSGEGSWKSAVYSNSLAAYPIEKRGLSVDVEY